MNIIRPLDFFQIIKGNHLLLDTNVFIDAFHHPGEFAKLFNELKDNNITVVTIDVVVIEFLKGASEIKKLEEKKKYVEKIIDAVLPIDKEIIDNVNKLLDIYKIEAKDVSIVDLLLGGVLVKYGKNIFLMTRDIKDFPGNIYRLETYLTLIQRKSIQNYGIYRYLT